MYRLNSGQLLHLISWRELKLLLLLSLGVLFDVGTHVNSFLYKNYPRLPYTLKYL